MHYEIDQGWLRGATRLLSPNWDARPAGAAVDMIVLHAISLPPGEYGGPWIDALFMNSLDPRVHPYFGEIAQLRVSAHLVIRRTGEITQYVSFDERAWHAGVSCFKGRERCNDFSIGIEFEGTDEDPYTDAQYREAAEVIAVLMQRYPDIARERIVGHCDIAPGRKTDPGPAFDWAQLDDALYLALNPPLGNPGA